LDEDWGEGDDAYRSRCLLDGSRNRATADAVLLDYRLARSRQQAQPLDVIARESID